MTLIPIRSEGSHPPLIVASQLAANGLLAHIIADGLNSDHPVFAFDRLQRDGQYENDLDVMARIHAEQLEQAGFDKPLCLAGYSFGAQLTYALAHQLLQRGHEIGLIAIVDDDADVHRRRFNIENISRDFTSSQVAARYAVDRVIRRKIPAKITLFRGERWFGQRQMDTACDWQYLAESGVDVCDLACSHSEIMSPPFLAQWIGHLGAAIRGESPQGVYRHVPAQTGRVPDAALSAFAKAKHGDLTGEIRDYSQALADCPDAPEWIRINLAAALEQAHRTDDAIAVLMPALDGARRVTNAHVALAQLLLNQGRKAKIAQLAESALALAAETPTDLQLRGEFYRICNLIGESQNAYLKALDIDPSWTGCRVPCAKAMLSQRQYEPLKKLIAEGLEANPGHPKLIEVLADFHASRGDPAEAEKILNDLIGKKRHCWPARAALIKLLSRQNRTEEVLKHAEETLALNPPHGPVLAAIATVHLANGQPDFAVELFRKATNRDENFLPSWIGLSQALEATGQHAKAIAVLRNLPSQHCGREEVVTRAGEIALNKELQLQ